MYLCMSQGKFSQLIKLYSLEASFILEDFVKYYHYPFVCEIGLVSFSQVFNFLTSTTSNLLESNKKT